MSAIFVVGMHRSGTSVTTRLTEIAGAYVGTENTLMEANEWNETGFWEDKRFAHINARLLEAFGGWVWDPPVFPKGWLDDERAQVLRDQAEALLKKEFEPHAMWAVKDPRVTLVLPFWHQLVENPRHILCVRNPLDVAASLSKRDGMPVGFSIALWHIHTLRALLDTNEKNRITVLYEDLVRDPLRAAVPLFDFIGARERLADNDVRAAVKQSVQSNLKHHTHSLEELLGDSRIQDSTKQLYRAFVEGDQAALKLAVRNAPKTFSVLYGVTHPCGQLFRIYCDAFLFKQPKPRRWAQQPAERRRTVSDKPGWISHLLNGWFYRGSRRAQPSE